MFHTVSHFIITSFTSSYRPESKPSSMINLYHSKRPYVGLFNTIGKLPGMSYTGLCVEILMPMPSEKNYEWHKIHLVFKC